MVSSFITYFYPDLQKHEARKFSFLSLTLFLIIGTYWLLRLLKNTIFMKVAFPESLGWLPEQGRLFQPIAKLWSPLIVLILVLVYSKLVDLFKKHQLFYILCSFYALLFALLAGALFVKEYYGSAALGRTLLASTGWISYFAIESFGSLVVALFWSFTNSITDADSAKRGFPIIVAMAQLGAIFGSGALFFSGSLGTLWPILLFATVLVALVIPLVYRFTQENPESLVQKKGDEPKKEGFFEGFFGGLTLLVSRPYLLGILIVSTFYEAICQIIEYQMQAQASISPLYSTDIAFAQFQSIYGVAINVVSFFIALLGTSHIIRRWGLRKSLFIYPAVVGGILIGLFWYFKTYQPTSHELIWVIFCCMIIIKGLGYAVNNPVKEMMYIPTSKDAKFKSKAWIDTFGNRFAKAGGAQVTNAFKYSIPLLMAYGTMVSFGLVLIWSLAAFYIGCQNQRLLKEKRVIE
jgi:AAA family ATP:ADP antiporter